MKQTIAGLSNERLESEIAAIYYRGQREAPGVPIQETGLLSELWAEFEERLKAGTISDDTDWAPREWREGWYE